MQQLVSVCIVIEDRYICFSFEFFLHSFSRITQRVREGSYRKGYIKKTYAWHFSRRDSRHFIIIFRFVVVITQRDGD